MADAPLVSVVLPTVGRPAALRRAARSVLAQTHEPLELVVVDGGETDRAAAVVDALDCSGIARTVVTEGPGRGAAAARNVGVEAANGAYVAFLDDDDEWHPSKVSRQVALFATAGPAVGLVYTGVEHVGPDGRTNGFTGATTTGDCLETLLARDAVGTFSSVMVTVDAFRTVGGLNEALPSWEDWEFYVRVATEYELGAIDQPLVRKHAGRGDQLSADYHTKRDVSAPELASTLRPLAEAHPGVSWPAIQAQLEFQLAQSALRNDAYGSARAHLLRAIRRQPTAPGPYLYLGLALGGPTVHRTAQRLKRLAVDRLSSDRSRAV